MSLLKLIATQLNEAEAGDLSTFNTNTLKIVTDLFVKSEGHDRYGVFLTDKSIREYLQSTGTGEKLLDLLSDEELQAIAKKHPDDSRIKRFESWGNFSDLITPPAKWADSTRVVFIDYPKDKAAKFEQAASNISSNPKAFKEELRRLMNHKYYVLSLNLTKAKEHAADVDSAGVNEDALAKVFNPYVVENYPDKLVLTGAKDEWYEAKEKRKSGDSTPAVDATMPPESTEPATDADTADADPATAEKEKRAKDRELATNTLINRIGDLLDKAKTDPDSKTAIARIKSMLAGSE